MTKDKYTHVPGQIHLSYNGFTAVAEWDDEALLYHGEITNIAPDVVTFQADHFCDLPNALADMVQEYIDARNG